MNRVALALAALAALVGGPASAQFYYEQEPYDAYEERYEYRGPPPRYRAVPPRSYDPYGSYTPRRNYRRARIGSVCVTSRGNCDAGDAFPVNTPCRCYIPGFGAKRGAIGF
jgi:hypothetical protein